MTEIEENLIKKHCIWWNDSVNKVEFHANDVTRMLQEYSKQQNAEYIEALRMAIPYVQGAYECAFPDQEENDYVAEKIKSLIEK